MVTGGHGGRRHRPSRNDRPPGTDPANPPSQPISSQPISARPTSAQRAPVRPAASRLPAWTARVRRALRAGAAGSQDRFGQLLLVIVVTYLLSAFTTGLWVGGVQIALFVSVTVMAMRSSPFRRRTRRLLVAVAIGGSAVALALVVTPSADDGAAAGNLWTALILLFTVAVIVRRVLAYPVVTLQSIFGAISAYMVLGLMFAAIYAAMNRLGGAFFAHAEPGDLRTFQYFSFTTLTTLGYGDFTAAAPGGQAVAVMEALVGQVFLATLVARLVAAFRPSVAAAARTRDRRRAQRRPPHGAGQGRAGARRISSRARARRERR